MSSASVVSDAEWYNEYGGYDGSSKMNISSHISEERGNETKGYDYLLEDFSNDDTDHPTLSTMKTIDTQIIGRTYFPFSNDNCCVRLSGFGPETNQDDILRRASYIGPVSRIRIYADAFDGKRTALIEYYSQDDAQISSIYLRVGNIGEQRITASLLNVTFEDHVNKYDSTLNAKALWRKRRTGADRRSSRVAVSRAGEQQNSATTSSDASPVQVEPIANQPQTDDPTETSATGSGGAGLEHEVESGIRLKDIEKKTRVNPYVLQTIWLQQRSHLPLLTGSIDGTMCGLENDGATCSLNTILQCFKTVKILVNHVVEKKYKNHDGHFPFLDSLSDLFSEMVNNGTTDTIAELPIVSAKRVRKALGLLFENGHTASYCFLAMYNEAEIEYSASKRSDDHIFKTCFSFEMNSIRACECSHELISKHVRHFITLYPDKSYTPIESLLSDPTLTPLEFCSKCNTTAHMFDEIKTAPLVMCIINRNFEYPMKALDDIKVTIDGTDHVYYLLAQVNLMSSQANETSSIKHSSCYVRRDHKYVHISDHLLLNSRLEKQLVDFTTGLLYFYAKRAATV